MRYMFVKLKNPGIHGDLYMLPSNFVAYAHIPIFRDNVSSVVVVDRIYIAGFSLMSTWEDIVKYNDDACIIYESDFIAFQTHDLNEIDRELHIENYRRL